jgi:hypothetical protein
MIFNKDTGDSSVDVTKTQSITGAALPVEMVPTPIVILNSAHYINVNLCVVTLAFILVSVLR